MAGRMETKSLKKYDLLSEAIFLTRQPIQSLYDSIEPVHDAPNEIIAGLKIAAASGDTSLTSKLVCLLLELVRADLSFCQDCAA